jgi:hypothetical protein
MGSLAIAIAIGHDAGNASMRAGGRYKWGACDWDAAAAAVAKLLGLA